MNANILLIDDDERLTALVVQYLSAAGLRLQVAGSLAEGRLKLAREAFDALVLDLMLPDGDGLDLCREVRAHPRLRSMPLLMLSARGEAIDRILGLELGADDYLAKPFESRELLARVKALIRRAAPQASSDELMRFGRLELDLVGRHALLDGQPREMSSHQFDMLVLLAQNAGRALSRERLMDTLKGQGFDAFDRSIDMHVSRIRAAIEDDPKNPRRVLTVRGVGYLFARKQDFDDTP